jgi:hypothetical protein
MKPKHRRTIALAATHAALWSTLIVMAPGRALAQRYTGPVIAGSRIEDSLRVEQLLGHVPLRGWSVRPFSWRESERLTRSPGDSTHAGRSWFEWRALPFRERTWFNSSFPYGFNDGAVWQGRGLTAALDGGVAMRAGWVSLTLAPMVWWAQNVPFTLMPNGMTGLAQYADGRVPRLVDLPQRFGDDPVARIDPGQSTFRIDAPLVTAGFTTANEWWGPMTTFPYLIGNNAPGFPRVFVGTSEPVNAYVAKVTGRVFWGRLTQSKYNDLQDSIRNTMATGIVVSLQPRWVPGLEIGAARFFHLLWPPDGIGWAHIRKPLETFLKKDVPQFPASTPFLDNQLASFFARWVAPRSGLEVYAEYGREDHSWNSRDLILEPDHTGSLGLGLQKVWVRADGGTTRLTVEGVDGRISILERHRGQGGSYVHTRLRSGHTNGGQLLGAPTTAGSGSGSVVALERSGPQSGWRFDWTRIVRHENGTYWETEVEVPHAMDVSHALGVERRWRTGALVWVAGLTGMYEFDRDLRRDATSLRVVLASEWRP